MGRVTQHFCNVIFLTSINVTQLLNIKTGRVMGPVLDARKPETSGIRASLMQCDGLVKNKSIKKVFAVAL